MSLVYRSTSEVRVSLILRVPGGSLVLRTVYSNGTLMLTPGVWIGLRSSLV